MPKVETTDDAGVLQEFSLGLNTLIAPNRLDPRYSPSATNCWYDDGAVQKRPGQLRTTTTQTVNGKNINGILLHTSVLSGTETLLVYASAAVTNNFLVYSTDSPNPLTMTGAYTSTAGTVTTSSISTAVVGVGTSFLTTTSANALIVVSGVFGIVQSVTNDTNLVLTANFGGTFSGSSYNILPAWPLLNRVSFADMNSKVWICGQGASAVSFNGTNTAYVSAFPQTAYSLSFSNYMFAASTIANPSRVYWSSLKDPTTWPASNFVDVNPDDGFPIVGLFYDGQSLCILKTNSMWKLSGSTFDPANPTYTLTQVYTPSDFFMNSPRSVQLFDAAQGFIMLGKKGLYSYNGAGAVVKMLNYDIIRSEFSGINGFTWGVVPNVRTEPTAIVVDGNYWLQCANASSTISTSDKELTYVIDKSGAIWKWTATANGIISDMAYYRGNLCGVNSWVSGTPGIMQLNYTTVTSDAQSTAIAAAYTTKIIQFKNMQRFGLAYVYLKKQSAGNMTFSYSIDEGSYTNVTIDMTTGSATRTKSAPITIGQVGYSIQFQITNNVAAQTFEFYSIEFDHQELRQ